MRINVSRRLGPAMGVAALGLLVVACNGILDVTYPGRIPTANINDPSLASVLTNSVVGDFECGYSKYAAGSAVMSDEYETSNGNVPLSNYGERNINADESDYTQGPCGSGSDFGIYTTLHTARFQAEDIYKKLDGWTDAQVSATNSKLRTSLKATVKTYGAYVYLFFGETFCGVAFDKATFPTDGNTRFDRASPQGGPGIARAFAVADSEFNIAIGLAQTAGNTDILNLAHVGLARTYMDQGKWAQAAATAALVDPGYSKNADRGTETNRRYNDVYNLATQLGAYTVADEDRAIAAVDPRIKIADAHRDSFNPGTELWITTRYSALGTPIPLASGLEARLIQAEALAQQDQVGPAMDIINAIRAEDNLTPVAAATKDEAITKILYERRVLLSFFGGNRFADILRYKLPWKGAFGSTVTANPYSGRPYGANFCWPFPTVESNGY